MTRKILSAGILILLVFTNQPISADEIPQKQHGGQFISAESDSQQELMSAQFEAIFATEQDVTEMAVKDFFGWLEDAPHYYVVSEAKTPAFAGMFMGAAFVVGWRRQKRNGELPPVG